MKVLSVIPSYEPAWAFGGTVTATSNLCKGLAKKGIDVTVYTTDADGKGGHLDVPLNEPIDLGGVKVWYFHCDLFPKKAFYSRGLALKLKNTITNFDLIEVSAMWQWIQINVKNFCNKNKIPYIIIPHNSLSQYTVNLKKKFHKKIFWELFIKETVRKSSALRFLTEEERELSLNSTLSMPSFIVPNGVDINKYKNDPKLKFSLRRSLRIKNNDIVLLFVGRIHPDKNIELVIKALSRIKQNIPFVLILIGPVVDKNYYKFLNRMIDDGKLKNKIKWLHYIPNYEMFKYYSIADMLILISKFEGLSMASIEALASGLPILISKYVSNWKKIEEDNAGIVIDLDVEEIYHALLKIMEDRNLLLELSHNARKSAEKRYDINKVADLMIKAYEDILTGRRSPELQWM